MLRTYIIIRGQTGIVTYIYLACFSHIIISVHAKTYVVTECVPVSLASLASVSSIASEVVKCSYTV